MADPRMKNYLARMTPAQRRRLREMRAAIKSVAPGAEETISYGIPAFKLNGRMLVWFAAWKTHSSVYPIRPNIQRANAAALKGYKTSKGTVQFPLEKRLPVALLKRLVKARMKEMRS